MKYSTNDSSPSYIQVDGETIQSDKMLNIIRKQGAIPRFLQEWILDNTLSEIRVSDIDQIKHMNEYRAANGLQDPEAFYNSLEKRHLSVNLLQTILDRPYKVIRYREERWGPAIESLYLKNKDKYDLVTYYRLESSDENVMQEIYFRLKDKEDTWDNLARQFPGNNPETTAQIGPVSVASLEEPILDILRKTKEGEVPRPITVGNNVVVVSLVEFKPSKLDKKLKEDILRDTFEEWLKQEYDKLIGRISFTQN